MNGGCDTVESPVPVDVAVDGARPDFWFAIGFVTCLVLTGALVFVSVVTAIRGDADKEKD